VKQSIEVLKLKDVLQSLVQPLIILHKFLQAFSSKLHFSRIRALQLFIDLFDCLKVILDKGLWERLSVLLNCGHRCEHVEPLELTEYDEENMQQENHVDVVQESV